MKKLNLQELESGFPVLENENQKEIKGGLTVYDVLEAINRGMTSVDGCDIIIDSSGVCTAVKFEGNYFDMIGANPRAEIGDGGGGSDSDDCIAFSYIAPEVQVYAPSAPKPEYFTELWSKMVEDPLRTMTINGGYRPAFNFTSNTSTIGVALSYVQSLVDQGIPYRQEYSYDLRTADTPAALAYMDCSELVCRYFASMGFISRDVQSMNSLVIRQYAETHPDMLTRLPNGVPPQAGDIFLWHRSDYDGHTGIIKSYDPTTGRVTVLEEYSYGEIHEAREIDYQLDSTALTNHSGWEGFYRPNVN